MPSNPNSSVQSSDMPIELSFDNGSTWKDLVCLTSYQLPLSTPLTATDTFCGKKVGMGNIEFNPSGEAVCETIPDADEVSAAELIAKMDSKESFLFRVQNPQIGSVGQLLYLSGSCKATNVTITGEANNLVTFSFTLTGEGLITRVKPS